MTPRYIVCLEPDVWLAPWSGDPGRTCDRTNAHGFASENLAAKALNRARLHRPFPLAVIEEVA